MVRICVLVVVMLPGIAAAQEGRTQARVLYSFEAPAEVAELARRAENVDLIAVADNVSEGATCARFVGKKGTGYCVLHLPAAQLRGWEQFDYLAVDVFTEDEHPYALCLELWDAASKNYPTRCTFENVTTRPGKQTLLYPIGRAKRNNKEGRDWDELEPRDKIDRSDLRQVKLFLTPLKDRDAVLWIDNIRLLQEDAAKPKLSVPLPDGAIAFNFGSPGSVAPGFRTIAAKSAFDATTGAGFVAGKDLTQGGEGWPDLLAGTFVMAPNGQTLTFRARVPAGDYHYWLIAGPIYRGDAIDRRLKLSINDRAIVDQFPSVNDYHSEKHLYRFLRTPYSAKPYALWANFIDRMYPVHTGSIAAPDGTVTVSTVNHFLSALVLVPATKGKPFEEFTATARKQRIAAFEAVNPTRAVKLPTAEPGDGDAVVFIPEDGRRVGPHDGPNAVERKTRSYMLAAAPGQRLTLRLAVTAFADLGRCTVAISDLTGPTTIPASAARISVQNFRCDGDRTTEMALIPTGEWSVEAGATQQFWMWLKVPADAAAGEYRGTVSLRANQRDAVSFPVTLTVYPFRLDPVVPASLGMYYTARPHPLGTAEANRALWSDQFAWMREIGFTATTLSSPTVTGLGRDNTVQMSFDRTLYELAKAAGFGAHPRQEQMATTLGIGRAIGRRLPGSRGAAVDRQPGIELRQPEFPAAFRDALRQYRDFLATTGLPVAVEVVDEPREVPNPWNRNLADTITYADMIRAAGLRGFITPMSDRNGDKDYTVLADHAPITSVHAWKASAGLMARARKNGNTLWLYNTGMDRFSWGFYAWRVGAEGRWEWHFCFPEDGAKGGYPGREWYNPFTQPHGYAPHAPAEAFPGGFLFQSAFLEVAEGITDLAYLHTLNRELDRAEKAGTHGTTVKHARAFLAALRRAIPEYPEVKGLASEADGALVGLGIDDDARRHLTRWRATVARFLIELAR